VSSNRGLPASSAASGLHVDSAHPGDEIEVAELVRSGVRAGRIRHALEWGFSAIMGVPFTMGLPPMSWLQAVIAYAILTVLLRLSVAPIALAPLRLVQHQFLMAKCRAAGIAPRRVRPRVVAVLGGKERLPGEAPAAPSAGADAGES
jgi:hypothetical protein